MEIYKRLNHKFCENFKKSINSQPELIQEAETKAKIIFSIAAKLDSELDSKTKKEIIQITNEIFCDLSISIYLSTCSINNPSKILLRRVLELGIAIIYFWDLPHKYWGWKKIESHDSDLSFRENLDHLGSFAYSEFLKNEIGMEAPVRQIIFSRLVINRLRVVNEAGVSNPVHI